MSEKNKRNFLRYGAVLVQLPHTNYTLQSKRIAKPICYPFTLVEMEGVAPQFCQKQNLRTIRCCYHAGATNNCQLFARKHCQKFNSFACGSCPFNSLLPTTHCNVGSCSCFFATICFLLCLVVAKKLRSATKKLATGNFFALRRRSRIVSYYYATKSRELLRFAITPVWQTVGVHCLLATIPIILNFLVANAHPFNSLINFSNEKGWQVCLATLFHWWRWRELNPRLNRVFCAFYVCISP